MRLRVCVHVYVEVWSPKCVPYHPCLSREPPHPSLGELLVAMYPLLHGPGEQRFQPWHGLA